MNVKTRIIVLNSTLASRVAQALVVSGHMDVEVITMEEGSFNVPVTREARVFVDELERVNDIYEKLSAAKEEVMYRSLRRVRTPAEERQRQKQDAQRQRVQAKARGARR